MNRLFTRVNETVQAVVFGTVAVAAVQGAMGGLMFWLLGLPAPVVWGLAMGLLAVVPVLGAFIVWLPAALSLALGASGERRSYSSPGVPEWLRPSTIFSTPFSWETA